MIRQVEWPVTATSARSMLDGVRDLSSSLARQSLLVAGVCLLADMTAVLAGGPVSQLRPMDWVALVVLVVADAALALPAKLSGWVAGAHAAVRIVAAVALVVGSGTRGDIGDAGFLIAGYRAGAWLRGRAAVTSLIVLALGILGAHLIGGAHHAELLPVEIIKNAVLPWLVGRYTTTRRAYIAELEQRAENQRRDARAAVDHAVAEERSAIARDLHDVISHHVSAIGVHAGAARLGMTAAAHSDGIAGSLSAVETASRSAMLDLRRLLDLLHGGTSDANRQPGLDNLEDLLDGVRRAGLPTRLRTRGVARPLPGSLDIALYRITQEMHDRRDRTALRRHVRVGDLPQRNPADSSRNGRPRTSRP
jgi:signal transduction histidine kinase